MGLRVRVRVRVRVRMRIRVRVRDRSTFCRRVHEKPDVKGNGERVEDGKHLGLG